MLFIISPVRTTCFPRVEKPKKKKPITGQKKRNKKRCHKNLSYNRIIIITYNKGWEYYCVIATFPLKPYLDMADRLIPPQSTVKSVNYRQKMHLTFSFCLSLHSPCTPLKLRIHNISIYLFDSFHYCKVIWFFFYFFLSRKITFYCPLLLIFAIVCPRVMQYNISFPLPLPSPYCINHNTLTSFQ